MTSPACRAFRFKVHVGVQWREDARRVDGMSVSASGYRVRHTLCIEYMGWICCLSLYPRESSSSDGRYAPISIAYDLRSSSVSGTGEARVLVKRPVIRRHLMLHIPMDR